MNSKRPYKNVAATKFQMRKSSFRSYQFKLKVSHRDPTLHLWIVQPPKRVVLIQKQKFIKSFRVQSGTWSYTLYMLPHTQTAKVEVCLGNPYFCIHHSWQKEVRTYTDTAFVYFFIFFYFIAYITSDTSDFLLAACGL